MEKLKDELGVKIGNKKWNEMIMKVEMLDGNY